MRSEIEFELNMSTRPSLRILAAAVIVVALAIAFFPTQGAKDLADTSRQSRAEVVPTSASLDAPAPPAAPLQREAAEATDDPDALMVHVLESDGTPSPQREVTVLMETDHGFRGIDVTATTDADGWAQIDRSAALHQLVRLRGDAPAPPISIGVRGEEYSYTYTEVDLEEEELIEIRLKPCTRILLHFDGFPVGLAPTLVLGKYDMRTSNDKIQGVLLDGNWWRYDYVTPGKTWSAVPVRPHYQEGQITPSGWRGTSL
jgi:hypothetical protein